MENRVEKSVIERLVRIKPRRLGSAETIHDNYNASIYEWSKIIAVKVNYYDGTHIDYIFGQDATENSNCQPYLICFMSFVHGLQVLNDIAEFYCEFEDFYHIDDKENLAWDERSIVPDEINEYCIITIPIHQGNTNLFILIYKQRISLTIKCES